MGLELGDLLPSSYYVYVALGHVNFHWDDPGPLTAGGQFRAKSVQLSSSDDARLRVLRFLWSCTTVHNESKSRSLNRFIAKRRRLTCCRMILWTSPKATCPIDPILHFWELRRPGGQAVALPHPPYLQSPDLATITFDVGAQYPYTLYVHLLYMFTCMQASFTHTA